MQGIAKTMRSLPDLSSHQLALPAFGGIVVIGGLNIVAVRLSNQDLPPFFGAGFRFTLAAGVLWLLIALLRVPLPRGRALMGSLIYGLLAFGAFIALAYWALQELPAAVAGVMIAAVPLLTLFLARFQGLERFGWRGLLGGVLTLAGISILVGAPVGRPVPVGSVVAMLLAAISLAEAGIVAKKFPPCHPVATNGLGMTIGAAVLWVASGVAGEQWALPLRPRTWLVLGHLALIGSVAIFGLYLYVLRRWSASKASYQFVLMPFVAALTASWLLDEPISTGLITGGVIVLLGVYVAALSPSPGTQPAAHPQQALSSHCPI